MLKAQRENISKVMETRSRTENFVDQADIGTEKKLSQTNLESGKFIYRGYTSSGYQLSLDSSVTLLLLLFR